MLNYFNIIAYNSPMYHLSNIQQSAGSLAIYNPSLQWKDCIEFLILTKPGYGFFQEYTAMERIV